MIMAVVIAGGASLFLAALPAQARLSVNGLAPMPTNARLAVNGLAPIPMNARLAVNGASVTGLDLSRIGQTALGK
jgi:hypothetical protein